MTLTATAARVREADASEVVMLAYWRTVLAAQPLHVLETRESRARRVVALIEGAIDYEPLLGLPMDVCNNPPCHTWVDEAARGTDGRIHCSGDCRDAADSDAYDAWLERSFAAGRDHRPEPSYDIDPMTGRWAS